MREAHVHVYTRRIIGKICSSVPCSLERIAEVASRTIDEQVIEAPEAQRNWAKGNLLKAVKARMLRRGGFELG